MDIRNVLILRVERDFEMKILIEGFVLYAEIVLCRKTMSEALFDTFSISSNYEKKKLVIRHVQG